MSEETHRVLDMLAQGKINVSEAEQLLQALNGKAPTEEPKASTEGEKKPKPRFLHVQVETLPGDMGRQRGPVNIRVPLGILRSGIKLAAVMPDYVQVRVAEKLRERGIDFDLSKMKPEDMDALVSSLSDLSVDIDSDKEKVRIFCD